MNRIKEYSSKWIASLKELKNKCPNLISEIRGRGYLVGIAMREDPTEIINKLREAGLLTVPASGNVIRLLPPYTVSEKELDQSVAILDSVISRHLR